MENIWMFLQQTAAASLVALFLLILQRIFLDKLSPRWQYGVWFVLLLRLLVPAGFGGRPTVLDVTFWVETLRTRVELGPARAAGKIGIPCFVGEDGSLTLDAAQVLQKWGNRC